MQLARILSGMSNATQDMNIRWRFEQPGCTQGKITGDKTWYDENRSRLVQ